MHGFIGDSLVTIGLEGLRWIKKIDMCYGGESTYEIEAAYKGEKVTVRYPDKAARDAIYERIAIVLGQADANRRD